MTPEQQADTDRRDLRRAFRFALLSLVLFGRRWRAARGRAERARVFAAIAAQREPETFEGIARTTLPPGSLQHVTAPMTREQFMAALIEGRDGIRRSR